MVPGLPAATRVVGAIRATPSMIADRSASVRVEKAPFFTSLSKCLNSSRPTSILTSACFITTDTEQFLPSLSSFPFF